MRNIFRSTLTQIIFALVVVTTVNAAPSDAVLVVNGSPVCNGTLLSQRAALFSAQCLDGRNLSQVSVRLGGGSQTLSSSRIVTHENYDSNTLRNNVGVINFNVDATMTTNVQATTCLADLSNIQWIANVASVDATVLTSGCNGPAPTPTNTPSPPTCP